jgi:hypothetical protein
MISVSSCRKEDSKVGQSSGCGRTTASGCAVEGQTSRISFLRFWSSSVCAGRFLFCSEGVSTFESGRRSACKEPRPPKPTDLRAHLDELLLLALAPAADRPAALLELVELLLGRPDRFKQTPNVGLTVAERLERASDESEHLARSLADVGEIGTLGRAPGVERARRRREGRSGPSRRLKKRLLLGDERLKLAQVLVAEGAGLRAGRRTESGS